MAIRGGPSMELAGLEPATSWVRSRRSPKLSYSPVPRQRRADLDSLARSAGRSGPGRQPDAGPRGRDVFAGEYILSAWDCSTKRFVNTST